MRLQGAWCTWRSAQGRLVRAGRIQALAAGLLNLLRRNRPRAQQHGCAPCAVHDGGLDAQRARPTVPYWQRPVGPCIVPELPADAHVRVLLNGRERQNYPLSDMILPPARIVALLSREMTLEPGDLIACGTSVGALPMRPGMVVEVAIDGIGTLRNIFAPTEAPA